MVTAVGLGKIVTKNLEIEPYTFPETNWYLEGLQIQIGLDTSGGYKVE
jgi:hypothetical protein